MGKLNGHGLMKTTLEMDGVFTEEDVRNRHIAMAQCLFCYEYSKWDKEKGDFKCAHCGSEKCVINSGVSLRTYNPQNHNKNKRPKKK